MIDCSKTENYFAEKRRMTMAKRLSAKEDEALQNSSIEDLKKMLNNIEN